MTKEQIKELVGVILKTDFRDVPVGTKGTIVSEVLICSNL